MKQLGVFELNGKYFVYEVGPDGAAMGEPKGGPFDDVGAAQAALAGMQQPAAQTAPPPAQSQTPQPVKAAPVSNDVAALKFQVATLQNQVAAMQNAGAGRVEAGKDPAESPFKSLGDQLLAEVKRANGYGYDPRQTRLNQKYSEAVKATGLNEGTLSDGGAMVQTDFSNTLMERAYEAGDIYPRTSRQPIGAGFNAYSALLIDETSRADGSRSGAIQMYWIGEAGTYTASRPKLRRYELALAKLVGLCYATDENLQDATQLEGLIKREFPKEWDYQVNNKIIRGTGSGIPMGILNASATVSVSKETGQAAATIVYDNILKMWARMWAPARKNAVWYYNQDCEVQLFKLALTVGTSALEPRFIGFNNSGALTAFGRPMLPLEQCSTLGTVGDLILFDPSSYLVIEKGGLDVQSSIHVAFTTGEQVFRFTSRVNGGPLWNSALTPANGTNTLSPYITLATRA